jgi:transcription elongation factor GreB
MPRLHIVAERPTQRDRVFFGALVELEDATGAPCSYRIVGGDEARPEHGAISIDSPLARRLLGRSVDDEVTLAADDGAARYTIVDISYPDPAA